MNKLNAAGALCLLFDDEDSGEVSEDELPDEVENAEENYLFEDDVEGINDQNCLLSSYLKSPLLKENMHKDQNISKHHVLIANMSISNNSDNFLNTSSDQILISESINTQPQPLLCTSFYQKTSSTARSSIQNKDSVAKIFFNKVKATKNLFKRGKIRKNISVKKVGLIVERSAANDACDKQELESESRGNDMIYGKQTKQMLEHDLPGYKWDKNPPSSSFKPIDNYTNVPKSNSCVSSCTQMIDYFNFFLNSTMLDLIVRYSNLKLRTKNLAQTKIGKN